jgi:hypothetical protein
MNRTSTILIIINNTNSEINQLSKLESMTYET